MQKKPNGFLYIGNVKWDNEYKNVVDFKDENARNEFFKKNFKKINANVLAINPNGSCKIAKNLEDLEKYNYIFYQNDNEVSSTCYCCFIKNWNISAKDVTTLNLQLDVFQQFFYQTIFYKSFIKRGHTNSDGVCEWVTPEPVGFAAKVEKDLTAFSDIDFTPTLFFDSNSVPDKVWSGEGTPTINFKYGGGTNGNEKDLCGFFRCAIFTSPSADLLNRIIHTWGFSETTDSTISHYNDLIGFKFLPKWVSEKVSYTKVDALGILSYVNDNSYISISDTISLDKNSLACGYTPRNKKMLTSVAKCYKIWNKNGLSIPLQPELLNDLSSLSLNLKMRPMGSEEKVEIKSYKDLSTRFFNVSYGYDLPFGFNSNVGVANQTAQNQLQNQLAVTKVNQVSKGINTAVSAIGGVAGVVGSAMAGDVAGAIQQGVSTVAGVGTSIAGQVVSNKQENYNNLIASNDLLASVGKSIGSSSDRTSMSNDFCKLRVADCSPLKKECEILDDFFDMYGYAIEELRNPRNWLKNRKKWNYLQTQNVNLNASCPCDYENILKTIFNNGVTLWHDYSTFGDYSQDNSIV